MKYKAQKVGENLEKVAGRLCEAYGNYHGRRTLTPGIVKESSVVMGSGL